MNMTLSQCIKECLNCHSICLHTITYCLEHQQGHAEIEHVRLLLDCSEICQTSANFMLRGSPRHTLTCSVCADICARCAESCERFEDNPQMQNCAAACRRCAESCEQMEAHA